MSINLVKEHEDSSINLAMEQRQVSIRMEEKKVWNENSLQNTCIKGDL